MFNAKQFLQRVSLAVSLSSALALAQAAPTSYHVTVNTTGLVGKGYVDAELASTTAASQRLDANLSNATGAFGAVDPSVSYNYGSTAAGYALNSAAPNYLSRNVTFGGLLGFDVLFDGPFLTATSAESSALYLYLFDSAFTQLGTTAGFNIAGFGANRIAIVPSAFISITANPTSAVPEPGSWLLMLTTLGLMGAMVKRRQA